MEENLKKALFYFLAFMVGGVIGISILNYIPDSLSFLSNGPFNFPIFGAIGFGICALVYKEYKKLLFVPLIIIVGFIVTLPFIYLILGAFS
jgi:hypothetical protein